MNSCVFVIPVIDRWLVHAPLHAVTALVNRTAPAKLKEGPLPNQSNQLSELESVITSEPESVPRPREGELCPKFLGLIPTRACNLSCVYCGFGADGAPRTTMDLPTAVASIDWMADHLQRIGKEKLEIHFFGGEPSVAWDVLVVAVHHARAVAARRGLMVRLQISTNGVFKEDKVRFIGDYFDSVVLSFDGTQDTHDRLRPMSQHEGSFEAVARTAASLSKSPVELCLRGCVTQDSVLHLQEIANWFCDTFQPSVINFEPLQPTPATFAMGVQPPDPFDFAINYEHASRTLEKRGIRPVYAANLTKAPRLSFCPVGKDALIVSPDGQISECYLQTAEWRVRGLNLVCGQVEPQRGIRLDFQAIQRMRFLVTEKPRCEHCFCKWSCAGGCHVNHSYPGCSESYDDFCIMTRIITACSLLRELGYEYLVESLLNDRSALVALSLQKSDCIEDLEVAYD